MRNMSKSVTIIERTKGDLKMRMVFCNIAWMKYYRGIMPNGTDEPFTSCLLYTSDAADDMQHLPVEPMQEELRMLWRNTILVA